MQDLTLQQIQLTVAHDLFHGLASLSSTVASVRQIAESPLGRIDDDDWTDLRDHLCILGDEIESQQYQAISRLAVYWPEGALGVLRPLFAVASPAMILSTFASRYATRAAARRVELTLEFESLEEFPPVHIEVNTIRRVFHNLMTNAVKYSFRGFEDRKRYIRIWAKRHDSQGIRWALCVENYGIGIDGDELHLVFEPGGRGRHALEENILGSGLGLTDAKMCMREHGGDLLLESTKLPGNAYLTTATMVFSLQGVFSGTLGGYYQTRGKSDA